MADQFSPTQREELRKLAERARQSSWRVLDAPTVEGDWTVLDAHGAVADVMLEEDADFIAAARSAIPALLDALDATEGEVERLKKLYVYLGKEA